MFFIIRLLFSQKLFSQHNILQGSVLREKIEILEYKTKMQSFFANLGFLPGCRVAAVKQNIIVYTDNTGIRSFQEVQTAQKRGLTASGGTDNGNDLSFFQ